MLVDHQRELSTYCSSEGDVQPVQVAAETDKAIVSEAKQAHWNHYMTWVQLNRYTNHTLSGEDDNKVCIIIARILFMHRLLVSITIGI